MLPPARIAARLSEQLQTSPPVDIVSALRRFADLQSEPVLPYGAAAVTVGLKIPNRRPTTVYDESQSPQRTRFTLAHELGHIHIPWHTGTIVSHPEGDYQRGPDLWRTIEREADQFAGEFLVPTAWLVDLLAGPVKGCALIAEVCRRAEVSEQVACFRVAETSPDDFLVVRVGADGRVMYSARSKGTRAHRQYENRVRFDPRQLARVASSYDTSASGIAGALHVFEFAGSTLPAPAETHRQRLVAIIEESGYARDERGHLEQALAGVFGAANGPGVPASTLVNRVKQRLGSDPKFGRIIEHPELDGYLAGRALEIEARGAAREKR